MMEIERNAFLVTGGASGLGYAVAQRLIQQGGRVTIADIDAAKGQRAAEALGDSSWFLEMDVSEEAAVARGLDQCWAHWGTVRGIVHCAGIASAEKVLRRQKPHRLETFQRAIAVNLVGTFNILRFAAVHMAQNAIDAPGDERGVIINTASIAAFEGQIGQVAYAASKGGIVAMTLPAARELAAHGIRIMAIAPGVFDTPLLSTLPAQVRTGLAQQVPFPKRLGSPADFAALVCHIIENEMLNGEVIRLDGGMRMPPT